MRSWRITSAIFDAREKPKRPTSEYVHTHPRWQILEGGQDDLFLVLNRHLNGFSLAIFRLFPFRTESVQDDRSDQPSDTQVVIPEKVDGRDGCEVFEDSFEDGEDATGVFLKFDDGELGIVAHFVAKTRPHRIKHSAKLKHYQKPLNNAVTTIFKYFFGQGVFITYHEFAIKKARGELVEGNFS